MNGSCGGSFDGELGSLIRNEAANLISRFGPNAPSGTKPRNKLRVAGCLLSEIGRPHSGVGEKSIDLSEQCSRVGHSGKISAKEDMSIILYEGRAKISEIEDIRAMKNEDWRARLQHELTESGKSAREVSLAAGKGPGYLHSLLKEGKDPTIDNLIAVCSVLNVSLAKVIYGYEMSKETEEILSLLEQSPNARDGILKILKQKDTP